MKEGRQPGGVRGSPNATLRRRYRPEGSSVNTTPPRSALELLLPSPEGVVVVAAAAAAV